MTGSSPEVHDLNKTGSDGSASGEEQPENDESTAKTPTADEAGEEYPDDLEDDTPDSGGSDDDSDTEKSEDEEKTLTEKLGLSFKLDEGKDFTDIREGDTVVIDTPIEGAKVGKVTDRMETWTGITQATVDTEADKYVVTPFEDEFSAKYVGKVTEKLDLNEQVLENLEPATIENVDPGDRVVLDCPEIGPTTATLTDLVESKNQGLRATFKAGDCYFVVYEEPTSMQTKEMPYIVGREK